jgi:hypothetical protein
MYLLLQITRCNANKPVRKVCKVKIQDGHLAAILNFGQHCQVNLPIRSSCRVSSEYKIQDVQLVDILDFGQRWFSKGIFP